jgi:UDP-glucose 4-epimerase
MKKVVVFGGSGFLGSYVADELTNKGYDVTIVDICKSDYLQSNQNYIEADILDFKDMQKVLKDKAIVYNFSAIAELSEAINEPIKTLNINVIGNTNLLEACKKVGTIERFIYASSAYAVSTEGSFYGISKQTSEKVTEEYYKNYGLKYTVIRYGSVYGERASKNNYIYKILHQAIKTGELQLDGDGEDLREYIHAKDAAKLSVEILQDKQFENEHIILTGTERLKRKELITMINEIMQNKLKIKKISDNNRGHYKITPYSYNPSTAKKLVSNPFIDLGQGLLGCIQEINKNIDK